jgi:phospholipid/cholesterol/gamma-HCH transport system substrate-binding protein
MEKETSNNLRLGIFVSTGIVCLIIGLYFIGSNKNMFNKNIEVSTNFSDVSGLIVGNNVRYFGLDIGTVDDIKMISEYSVKVTMIIDEKYRKFIRKNSICTIGTDGLMGNKLVNINGGNNLAEFVEDKDVLKSKMDINIQNMLSTLDSTNQNFTVVSSHIRDITSNVSSKDNILNSLIYDREVDRVFQTTLANLEKSSFQLNQFAKSTNEMSYQMNHGRGLVNKLIRDTAIVYELNNAIQNMNQSSKNLSNSTQEVNKLVQKINTGKGTISLLINDSAMPLEIKQGMTNLNTSSQSLSEVLEALKHNFLLRGYFKKLERSKSQKAPDTLTQNPQ